MPSLMHCMWSTSPFCKDLAVSCIHSRYISTYSIEYINSLYHHRCFAYFQWATNSMHSLKCISQFFVNKAWCNCVGTPSRCFDRAHYKGTWSMSSNLCEFIFSCYRKAMRLCSGWPGMDANQPSWRWWASREVTVCECCCLATNTSSPMTNAEQYIADNEHYLNWV